MRNGNVGLLESMMIIELVFTVSAFDNYMVNIFLASLLIIKLHNKYDFRKKGFDIVRWHLHSRAGHHKSYLDLYFKLSSSD